MGPVDASQGVERDIISPYLLRGGAMSILLSFVI